MRHASVFSGIGGPEVAAEMLGWENLFHCEINPFGRAILDYWFPNSESYEDITKTDFSKWRGQVDVLTGGFPCQPFSYAGQRRGSEDDRYLWPYMFRCIDQIRPAWVVAENVAGILTMVEQGKVSPMESQGTLFDEVDGVPGWRLRETFTLQRICDDLEGHGYEVQPVLVPACSVGAPHRRDRVFIVARRVEAVSEDTMHGGQLHRPNEEQGSERNERHTCAGGGKRICGETSRTTSADTANDRLQHGAESRGEGCETGTIQGQRNRAERNVSTSTNGNRGTSADTDCNGHRTQSEGRGIVSEGQDITQAEECGRDRPQWTERLPTLPWGDEAIAGCGRWQNFPTVSPVHRGNDGIPFSLDDLAISAGKWRTESLKAYGNAIVPQVMYEIFRAIEIITDKTQKP